MTEQITSLIFITLFAACADEPQAKDDAVKWMPLSLNSLANQQWRAASPTRFASVSLDVNGDRLPDRATLVVSDDLKQSGVEVCYGEEEGSIASDCTVIAIEENMAEVMGLEKKSPGCYGYYEDDRGIPSNGKKVCSQNDVIEYFRFGSASSFLIYEKKLNTFKRYWDSD